MNVALAGHVDHGKSTLIGRILYDTKSIPHEKIEEIKNTCEALGRRFEFAYLVDALEEEIKEEMTIETSHAFFKTPKRMYALIDVPGHKEFLKNMVTGATYGDVAILVVDATKGMEEQSKRHAYLISLLGIKRVIVVVNKMDLIGYEEEKFIKVKREILDYLSSININPLHIIPISAYNGDFVVNKSNNLSWFNGPTVVEALDLLEDTKFTYDFRMPIQDCYNINGEKVYVGTILAGEISKGDSVKIYPQKVEVKIKKILLEDEVENAEKPKSIGLIFNRNFNFSRGNVVCKGKPPKITREINALIFCLIDKVKSGDELLFSINTQESKCKIHVKEKIDILTLHSSKDDTISETEFGKVKLILDKPCVIERFNNLPEMGRFTLKRNGRIIAGGII